MTLPLGSIYIVTAPSGAGKTSLVNALIERVPEAALSVSHTTRSPRPGEVDGRHYHFIDDARFQRMVERGEFLEHATVFGKNYGTALAAVNELREQDRDVILEIDWQGARQVHQAIPESIGIFILPPGLDVLEQRLRGRGKDAPEQVARRLSEARLEMSHHAEFEYLVINDDFETALNDLVAIVHSNRLRTAVQRQRHAALIDNLLD
ncbi:MAG: guanylate kinase [Xanthomonadales bacterium]|nr:guanylate kinase [Xanthomonadales bacterium]